MSLTVVLDGKTRISMLESVRKGKKLSAVGGKRELSTFRREVPESRITRTVLLDWSCWS
jgi:hypothetical protein